MMTEVSFFCLALPAVALALPLVENRRNPPPTPDVRIPKNLSPSGR